MNTLTHLLHVRFLVLFLCGPATLFSASVDDLKFEIIGNAMTITDCAHGAQGVLIIPSQIKGAPVTKIGVSAFEGVTNLTQIVLPDTITEIADGAFSACLGLTDFTFPGSVVSIGENAFAGCDNLINIYFEGAAPSTGADPFIGVRANAYVEPSNVQSFGGYGVQWNGLSVEEILFSYVVDGSEITLTDYPEDAQGVLTIPATMFGKPVTKIGADTFLNCGALTKILIPEGVTEIESRAFQECSSLTEVVIPDSVTSLGAGLFWQCPNLNTVTLSKNLTALPSSLFYQCTGLESISIPVGVTEIESRAFWSCYSLTEVVIPQGVLDIGNEAFSYCGYLTNISIPDSVSTIGNSAFRNCVRLVRILVPENVTNIDDRAFENCSNLLGVEFSNQSFSLGLEVFEGCSSLRGLYFSGPAPVITAGTAGIALPTRIVVSEDHQDSFGGYGAIWNGLPVELGNEQSIYYQYLEYPSSVTITDYWEGIAGELVIPDEMFLKPVTAIAQDAFRDCAALTRIVIPEGVTNIGYGSFRDCRSLESLEIPASIEFIGLGVITGCVSLTNLTVQEANQIYQSINGVLLEDGGRKAVGFARGLSTVTIPSGVINIMPNAFFGSIHLTNVVIPESVVSVEGYAFKGCSNLLSITIPENVLHFGPEVFTDAINLRSIVFSGSAPPSVVGNSFGVSAIAVVNEIHAPSFGGDGALWNGLTVRARSDQLSEVLLLELLSSPDDLLFNARGLAQGAAYQIQSSADLQLWSSFHDFTATGDRELVTHPRPEVGGLFFRLHEISEQLE